jgi:hypothetical protein
MKSNTSKNTGASSARWRIGASPETNLQALISFH